jgi:hypothetical protein
MVSIMHSYYMTQQHYEIGCPGDTDVHLVQLQLQIDTRKSK